jgi:hypothetical protein
MTDTRSTLPPLDKHRVASALFGVVWIVARVIAGALLGAEGLRFQARAGLTGALAGLLEGLVVLIPIAAIWFAEPLAGEVPPTLVRAIAWATLLLLTVGDMVIFAVLAPR